MDVPPWEMDLEHPPKKFLGSLEKPLSVGDLTELVKADLESTFSDIAIIGEISNFKAHPASGHYYFSMKDDRASISAVMFKTSAQKLKFRPGDGQRIIAMGRITVYPPRGNYQILVTRMEPEGKGALQMAFEQLKKKLEAEGCFALERKRPIPKFPKGVGLVTASSGAAVRDMLHILDRRFSGLKILIYSVRVQGDGSAQEIATAIQDLNAHFSDELDVLIVGRGGGSMEDLWAFNEEVVARAIFQSKIPVISAVGHEVDFTIADFVADLRAPTPSAAAELVIGNKLEIIQHLEHLVKRLLQVTRRLEYEKMKLDDLVQRMVRALETRVSGGLLKLERLRGRLSAFRPDRVLAMVRERLESLERKLLHALPPRFDRTRREIDHAVEKLALLNPRTIMDRGYSIVRVLGTKKVVMKVSDVRMGDKLLIELSKGQVTAKV